MLVKESATKICFFVFFATKAIDQQNHDLLSSSYLSFGMDELRRSLVLKAEGNRLQSSCWHFHQTVTEGLN